MTNLCLFCNGEEPGYKPEQWIEFICGDCTQRMLAADQEDLKRAHVKATGKGYPGKALVIALFLTKETEDGIRPVRRNTDRKRIVRVFGVKARSFRRSESDAQTPLLQTYSNESGISSGRCA